MSNEIRQQFVQVALKVIQNKNVSTFNNLRFHNNSLFAQFLKLFLFYQNTILELKLVLDSSG